MAVKLSGFCHTHGIERSIERAQGILKGDGGHPKLKKTGMVRKSFAMDVSQGNQITENGYFRLESGLSAKILRCELVSRYSNLAPHS